MLKRKKTYILFATILLPIITLIFNPALSQEETTPLLYVDPPTILDLPPSETFTINVKIANITNLYGLDVQLEWDPSILEYVNHAVKIPVESHPDGVLHNPVIPIKNLVNSTAGTYWLAYAAMAPALTFNGSGTIFNMTFHVGALGQSPIHFYKSKLVDKNGEEITLDVQHGYFSNFVPPEAKIYVDPKQIINATILPCTNFTIDINLEQVLDLYSFEFWLSYNTTILDAVNVDVNPAFPSPYNINVNEPEGQVQVAASLIPPSPSIEGNLTPASITFHTTNVGETVFNLHNVTLLDSSDNPIDYEEPVDGYFNNILKAKLHVDPAELIAPSLTPGSNFSISIKMEQTIDFYSYQFNLTYNTNVLTTLGVIIVPPTNETSFVTEVAWNDEIGNIWVNVTYKPPAEPITIMDLKTIANIYFQVQNYGCTTLNLQDTKITDQNGVPIPHDAYDGYFCTIRRDIAIVNVGPYPTAVYRNRIVNITVTAANLGDAKENFTVTAYYNQSLIGTKTVTNLLPTNNITLVFAWNTTGLTAGQKYVMSAEASQVPYEINLENNVYIDGVVKIKLLGDVNGDGVVDMQDLVAVTSIYGVQEDDPRWNPEADVAPPYGLIDIADVVTVTSTYGQTY